MVERDYVPTNIDRLFSRYDRILDDKEIMKTGYDELGDYYIADREDGMKDEWNITHWERRMKRLNAMEEMRKEKERREFRRKFGVYPKGDEKKVDRKKVGVKIPSSRSGPSSCSPGRHPSTTTVQPPLVKPKKDSIATETTKVVAEEPEVKYPWYFSPAEPEEFEGVGEPCKKESCDMNVPTNADLRRKVQRVHGWRR